MQVNEAMLEPRSALQRELSRRCESNPRYSLRSFARALSMSHTVLSLVLSGKRPLSKFAAPKVADILGLNPKEKEMFLNLRAPKKKTSKEVSEVKVPEYQQMTLDVFSVIADVHHYWILSLLDVPNAKFEARWISKQLSITQMQAQIAMERLLRLKLVERVNGKWKQSQNHLKVENTISTGATRKHHKQILTKALNSLENDPIEVRDFSAMTMAIDPKHIPYATERIRKFRRSLMEELESKGSPKAVYNLAVQIFPVSIIQKKSKIRRTKS